MPIKEPMVALMGDTWKRSYGEKKGRLHFHNILEIGYCYYGNGIVTYDTFEENIQNHRYTQRQISIVPQNVPHTTHSDEGSIDFWEYLFIDTEKYLKDFFPNDQRLVKSMFRDISSRPMFMEEEDYPQLGNIICAIINAQKEKPVYYEEVTRGLIYSLLMIVAAINREYAKDIEPIKETSVKIKEVISYIGENYMRDIKISELAEICSVSETHFRRLFGEAMNMTPLEYVNLVRIQAACDLLSKTRYSMETVAEKVGFQTVSTFNRNFRRFTRTSPYQWKINANSYEKKVQEFKISAYKGWE